MQPPTNDNYDFSQGRVDISLSGALRYRSNIENTVSNEVLIARKKSKAFYPAAGGHWGRALGYDRFPRISKCENKNAGIWNAGDLGD